jgi:Mn2+/Fe2+ NRAMP family transporter
MVWSNVIAFFVIVTTATILPADQTTLQTAADAAKALGPLAGPYATYLFAVADLTLAFSLLTNRGSG